MHWPRKTEQKKDTLISSDLCRRALNQPFWVRDSAGRQRTVWSLQEWCSGGRIRSVAVIRRASTVPQSTPTWQFAQTLVKGLIGQWTPDSVQCRGCISWWWRSGIRGLKQTKKAFLKKFFDYRGKQQVDVGPACCLQGIPFQEVTEVTYQQSYISCDILNNLELIILTVSNISSLWLVWPFSGSDTTCSGSS